MTSFPGLCIIATEEALKMRQQLWLLIATVSGTVWITTAMVEVSGWWAECFLIVAVVAAAIYIINPWFLSTRKPRRSI